jgi:hypothetical protein
MIRNTDDHRVNLPVYGVEQLSIVSKPPRLGVLMEGIRCAFLIHVTEGNDILGGNLLQILRPLPTAADDGQIQAVIGAGGSRGVRRTFHSNRGESARSETHKGSSTMVIAHGVGLLSSSSGDKTAAGSLGERSSLAFD